MDNGKIKTLEELGRTLAPLRAQKRIVLCHGVFDLLHIGHIRHFEQAKSRGDILVVTVTPDRFVNKGPHRPVFTEDLRVEAIARLDCVDYVAVNQWPMAKETIEILRPNVFAKGGEYREAGKDRTGNISVEEEAVRSIGAQMVYTEDLTFSSSHLLNHHLAVLPQEVRQYLSRFSSRHTAAEVLRYLERAEALRVLVVGEAIVDEYQYCEAIGKSSKEPMLAVRRLSTEKFAGGVLAVASHVANFCREVNVLTFLGAENSQEDFIRSKLHPRVEPRFLYQSGSPTIVKRRLIEAYYFHKLLEVYEIDGELRPEDDRALCRALEEEVAGHDVVIVADYGHGMLSPGAVQVLSREARFLAVNAQSNAGNLGYHTISKYPRADYMCLTENELRLETRDRWREPRELASLLSRRLRCPRLAVTRGSRGCLTYGSEGFFEVPAFATRVVDRMGAGDSFLALTAPCVAQDAPMEVVGFIGNAAGAHAVATVGHRQSTEKVPLFRHVECLLK